MPSATQLRNARKRRAKQQKKQQQQQTQPSTGRNRKSSSNNVATVDPSAQYLQNPHAAPIVRAAHRFFAQVTIGGTQKNKNKQNDKFCVYQHGPTTGWRTVSKLPVRRNPSGQIVMGMFQPNSHAVAAHNDYPAHHKSINQAMQVVTEACETAHVEPYDETTGQGYLRYVAMNVERTTGAVQMTLIWNDQPYPTEEDNGTVVFAEASKQDEDPNYNITSSSLSPKKIKRKQSTSSPSEPSKSNSREAFSNSAGRNQLQRLVTTLLEWRHRNTPTDGNTHDNSYSNRKRKRGPTQSSPSSNNPSKQQNQPPFRLHSLWVHYNAAWKHSNAIFDITNDDNKLWQHVYGPRWIQERLKIKQTTNTTLHFGPNVFRQANLDAFESIVRAIRKHLSQLSIKGKEQPRLPRCVELYGGVGTIGLHVLDLVESLVCSDENPHNRKCFEQSVSMIENDNDSAAATTKSRATYISKNASDMVQDTRQFSQRRCDVLIVDPPRKGGLDADVVQALTSHDHDIRWLIYVSCGFDAFQRDCHALLESRQWNLDHVEGHILFPGSNALETLAFFSAV